MTRLTLATLPLGRRISVLVALSVGLAVLITSIAAYLTMRTQLQDQRDATLLNRARAAVQSPLSDPGVLVRVPVVVAVGVLLGVLVPVCVRVGVLVDVGVRVDVLLGI